MNPLVLLDGIGEVFVPSWNSSFCHVQLIQLWIWRSLDGPHLFPTVQIHQLTFAYVFLGEGAPPRKHVMQECCGGRCRKYFNKA
ncbi:hypothetical protein M513_13472 [Trichuris suis]|uniref:Uncharacterized protein n=1 Tax=Trichuris suis TaxID=68888 RepID=A0A085LKI4_9BILA|nr:hypothetical protein M513_13642 [Trichuris suis]KFD45648.1 hypothetical protein M513_13472 [Trichuris suis]